MPSSAGLQRADSCSPVVCSPGVFEPGSKGFIVQPPWMPHHLELREKPDMEHREHSSEGRSVFDVRAGARCRQQASFGDLADELTEIILDMVWRLETQRSSHAQRQPATAVPASSGTAVSDGGADAASSSCISGSHTSSSPTGGDVSFPSGDGTGGSSAVRSSPQQPEVSRHSAKEEVAAWASYRLVCRRWNDHFRRKSLALRFDGPLSDVQLSWLAAGPAAVRSLCFGPGELRAFRVLGSYQFQAAAAPSLATLRGVPLSNCRDLTTRLSDYSRLRHLHAAGASPALRFAELPPSLRTLEVEGLERCNLRSGLQQGDTATSAPAAAAAAAPTCGQPLPLPPLTNANLRSISLVSSDTLQLYPDWLSGLQGAVSINCKDLVLPLPPRQIEGETRFMRVETLAQLLADSSIDTLRLHFKEMVLLDFVATAWPVVVYVLLEGRLLLDTLQRNHPGVFDTAKVDGGVMITRREPWRQA